MREHDLDGRDSSYEPRVCRLRTMVILRKGGAEMRHEGGAAFGPIRFPTVTMRLTTTAILQAREQN